MRLAQKDASEAMERAQKDASEASKSTEFRAQEAKERTADRSHREELLQTKLLKADEEKTRDHVFAEKLKKLKLE